LEARDRLALAHRLIGATLGLALIAWSLGTSSWNSPLAIGGLTLIAVTGPISYHLLTSLVRCPTCGSRVVNFRISAVGARRKLFPCDRCGTVAYLREGFYWQRDVAG
jgi:hypothetical protein